MSDILEGIFINLWKIQCSSMIERGQNRSYCSYQWLILCILLLPSPQIIPSKLLRIFVLLLPVWYFNQHLKHPNTWVALFQITNANYQVGAFTPLKALLLRDLEQRQAGNIPRSQIQPADSLWLETIQRSKAVTSDLSSRSSMTLCTCTLSF